MKRIGLAALLALALAFPAAAVAASGGHEISVYGSSGKVVARFYKAKCANKGAARGEGPTFLAEAVSTDGKYELLVRVYDFFGFKKEYVISQGSINPNPSVSFFKVGTPFKGPDNYSNRFVPSFPSPGFGEIAFREAGGLLGVGYGPSMYSQDLSNAIFLTGVVECEYKKKKTGKGKRPYDL